MAASILWDHLELTPSEEEDERNISIEWEMIRIQDGERLTNAEMNDRNSNFAYVFANIENASRRKGWVTSGGSLTVFSLLPGVPEIEVELIEEPNDGTEYWYFPGSAGGDVEIRDRTLFPNNLYFYYVRTVRIEQDWDDQLQDYVMIRSVSVWVEVPVTTHPIQPPHDLRQEDPMGRIGFNGQTMALVSWAHPQMQTLLEGMGEYFLFQYQIREGEGVWGDVRTVPPEVMTAYRLNPTDPLRIEYLLTGLEHSSIYQMRVRLYDAVAGDTSLWSNTITIVTEIDQGQENLDREAEDWLNYLRRRLEELLRQPFWTAQRTPTSHIMVFRPDDIFAGLMLGTPGTAIPLHNSNVDLLISYLPLSIIQTANEERRGFSTTFNDLQFLFAPSFLNEASNRALMDMLRSLDARGSQLTESFVRLEINRAALTQINNVPAITPRTAVSMELVGTATRNIRTWDRNMSTRAENIIERWLADPVIREGIIQMLLAEYSNEEISDHIYHIVERVEAELIAAVAQDLHTGDGGILTDHRYEVRDFDSAMHVIARGVTEDMFVAGHSLVNNNWQPRTLVEHHNGRAFIERAPGTFAFTGRVVNIPEIETTPRGPVVTSIVARYGLEDLFGLNVDLRQNANRRMVVGSIARMAGVPQNADPIAWANQNLNVQLSSRNATGLISRQEAIAVTMALYEHRTGTRINTLRIQNNQHTNGMTLDPRYAQAVRVAFDLGFVTDTTMNPAGQITIGEFLDMLSIMSSRIRI
jgi:hypothetical protein